MVLSALKYLPSTFLLRLMCRICKRCVLFLQSLLIREPVDADKLVDRFRANLVVTGEDVPFAEDTWKTVQIGNLVFEVAVTLFSYNLFLIPVLFFHENSIRNVIKYHLTEMNGR